MHTLENRTPTIRDVAKMAEVSVSTVSRYLNRSGYVSVEVGQRIDAAVSRLHYVPSPIAQRLRQGLARQIALIVPDITNPYYAKIYAATQEIAMEKDFTVWLYNALKNKDEHKGIELCRNFHVDGVIFCSVHDNIETMRRLNALEIPTVVFNKSEDFQFDTVHSEGGHGIQIATRHMIDLGHRQIAYAGGAVNTIINRNRLKGYKRALQEAGIPIDNDYIFEMDFSMDAGYKTGLYFAGLRRRPTAIVAANDSIALGVMMAMKELDIDIPGEISLSGEDDIEYAKISRPPLTTIINSPAQFAQKACEFLFDRILNGYTGPPRIYTCQRELIVRDSTRRL